MSTKLDGIKFEDFENKEICVSELTKVPDDFNECDKIVFDLSQNEELRFNCLQKIVSNNNDIIRSILNRLNSVYIQTNLSVLEQFFLKIIKEMKIETIYKVECCKFLTVNKIDEAFVLLSQLFPELHESTSYIISIINILFENELTVNDAVKYFRFFIDHPSDDIAYKYRQIVSCKHLNKIEFAESVYNLNSIQHSLLFSQWLLNNNANADLSIVYKKLVEIASNESLSYNERADASDILLSSNNKEYSKFATDILDVLAFSDSKGIKTLYTNAQNVHSLTENINKSLEFLIKFNSDDIDLITIQREFEQTNKIISAFYRIENDCAKYGVYNLTLKTVLKKVWVYILQHTSSTELKKRLEEELTEMSGTCSSGFITRLINTISGFGDFNMTISWEEQINANVFARLNAVLQKQENADELLEQMSIPAHKHDERVAFSQFFGRCISKIISDLWDEFKECDLSREDFDLYIRNATTKYVCG